MSEIELQARAVKIEQQAACLDANYRTIAEQRVAIGKLQEELKNERAQSAKQVDELNATNVSLVRQMNERTEELRQADERVDNLTEDFKKERGYTEAAEKKYAESAQAYDRLLIYGYWFAANFAKLEHRGVLKLPKPVNMVCRWRNQEIHSGPFPHIVNQLDTAYANLGIAELKATLKV